jgi:protein O-GlcNAc transferase
VQSNSFNEDAFHALQKAMELQKRQALAQEILSLDYSPPEEREAARAELERISADYARFVEKYRHVLELISQLPPPTAEQLNDHGTRLMDQSQYEAAATAFRRAIEINPGCGPAWGNLAFLTANRGQHEEASRLYDEALRRLASPEIRILRATMLPTVYDDLADVARARGRFEAGVAKLHAANVRADPARTTLPNFFYLAYQGYNDRQLMAQLASLAPPPPMQPRKRQRPAGDRIRLGFVSRYFFDHTIGQLNVGIIERLDRRRFELIVLATPGKDDALARRIRQAADRYVEVPTEMGPAVDIVAQQELDILHYPDIGMAPFTYTLAHLRLAPIQTVTWGHPVTTGLPTIDHFISCRHAETAGADSHYTERLVRLERLNVCLDRPLRCGPVRKREHFRLRDEDHVYACPQMLLKFHPLFDEALAGILRDDPRGVVVVIEDTYPERQERLQARWSRTMPDVAQRIRFIPHLPRADFLELLGCADVMLDPFPFGGGHTSYEALALGLPVVTLAGEFLRGRLAHAMYQQMGYLELVAADVQHYVRLAVRLAADRPERSAASAAILASCPSLFDDRAALREMEDFWESLV